MGGYTFEKLQVYQESMELVEKIYQITKDFPSFEQFGITSQLRRAALSISLNIAEGKGRYHTKIFLQFLYQARGSLYETIALIKLSHRLKYLDKPSEQELLSLSDTISTKLSNLINSMKD